MDPLRLLYPRISLRTAGKMSLLAAAGALLGGIYGIVHDQVTYSISEEYFTKFKFQQFAYADPGGHSPRLFAGIIGFLATWWVGALSAWVLARVSLNRLGFLPPFRKLATSFGIVFAVSFAAALAGWGYGKWRQSSGYAEGWLEWMDAMQIDRIEDFMTVGYIHNSSYLGGTAGTVFAILYLIAGKKRELEKGEGQG